MNWILLEELHQLEEIKEKSYKKAQLIFKHSTRCIISKMALQNFERDYKIDTNIADSYFLDLIKRREISNTISETYNVVHQSPQIIIIKDGKAIYNESHEGIDASIIEKFIA